MERETVKKMLRVLLIDDEPFILQGLKVLLNWEDYGFEIVRTACNGQEALEYLKENQVELILADIKMPGMTGLELLEYIRKENVSEAYFAILSGYNDFKFVRDAVRNACVDYILKPVSREELVNLLARVTRMHEECLQKKAEASRQESAYLARNLIAVICGKYDETNLNHLKEKLRLSNGIRYIALELERGAQNIGAEDMRCQQRRLYEVCSRLLEEDSRHCFFDVSRKENRYDIGFVYCRRMAEAQQLTEQEYLDRFLEKIRHVMQVPVVMLVGNEVDSIEKIGESYRTAAVARSFQDFRLAGQEENQAQAGVDLLHKQLLDNLVNAIEQNNKGEISGCVAQIYEEMNGSGMDVGVVGLNMNYLLFQLVHLAVAQEEGVNQEEVLRYITANAFDEGTIRGSRMHLVRFAGEYADYLAQLRGKAARGVLGEVEKEVRDNYAQNLTLKELSRKYFVNSAYLGQLFRKKYEISFKDYLNNYRVDRAAELLLHTDMKVYEVAERVGYHDLDYFINRFIAVKGCTPARFRRQTRE